MTGVVEAIAAGDFRATAAAMLAARCRGSYAWPVERFEAASQYAADMTARFLGRGRLEDAQTCAEAWALLNARTQRLYRHRAAAIASRRGPHR